MHVLDTETIQSNIVMPTAHALHLRHMARFIEDPTAQPLSPVVTGLS